MKQLPSIYKSIRPKLSSPLDPMRFPQVQKKVEDDSLSLFSKEIREMYSSVVKKVTEVARKS